MALKEESEFHLVSSFTEGVTAAVGNLEEMLPCSSNASVNIKQTKELHSIKEISGLCPSGSETFALNLSNHGQNLGVATLIFTEENSNNLAAILMDIEPTDPELQEDKGDILCEVSNIVLNTCLGYLADDIIVPLLTGVPYSLKSFTEVFPDSDTIKPQVLLSAKFANESLAILAEVSILLPRHLLK